MFESCLRNFRSPTITVGLLSFYFVSTLTCDLRSQLPRVFVSPPTSSTLGEERVLPPQLLKSDKSRAFFVFILFISLSQLFYVTLH